MKLAKIGPKIRRMSRWWVGCGEEVRRRTAGVHLRWFGGDHHSGQKSPVIVRWSAVKESLATSDSSTLFRNRQKFSMSTTSGSQPAVRRMWGCHRRPTPGPPPAVRMFTTHRPPPTARRRRTAGSPPVVIRTTAGCWRWTSPIHVSSTCRDTQYHTPLSQISVLIAFLELAGKNEHISIIITKSYCYTRALFILCWLTNYNNYIKSSPLPQKYLFLVHFYTIGIIVKRTFFSLIIHSVIF